MIISMKYANIVPEQTCALWVLKLKLLKFCPFCPLSEKGYKIGLVCDVIKNKNCENAALKL